VKNEIVFVNIGRSYTHYIEMALKMLPEEDLPTKRFIATDPKGFMKMALKESPFTKEFDADDIGGWLKSLPNNYSIAIIWYYKMKPYLHSSDGAKLFERSILPGYEAKDRDAPRSWITVARRVLGEDVPPRSGSIKEIYKLIFDFLRREEENSLLAFVHRESFLDNGVLETQELDDIACYMHGEEL